MKLVFHRPFTLSILLAAATAVPACQPSSGSAPPQPVVAPLKTVSAPAATPAVGPLNVMSAPAPTSAASADVAAVDMPPPTPNALPFTIELVPASGGSFATLPAMHGYAKGITKDGRWLLVGGRITFGLHMFQADKDNFPKSSAQQWLWVIDPKTGASTKFDTTLLGPELSGPLSATNPQAFQDPATGQMYLIGGYGWDAQGKDMKTFDTILRFDVSKVAAAISAPAPDPKAVSALFERSTDKRFAVTGGALHRLGNSFFLVFGQRFDGQYRPFGSSGFTQTYTETVAQFTLKPGSLAINAYGALTSAAPDQPYHRRDGNIVISADPATGDARIAAFGGVFAPGKIAAYVNPIYIAPNGQIRVDRSVEQLFSQYQCPVVVAWDSEAKVVYHTLFGGVGDHFHFQTKEQAQVYARVTQQGRNDGLPFTADITTVLQKADGTYQQWLFPTPMPDNQLIGGSTDFIVDAGLVAAGGATHEGVIQLSKWKVGEKKLVGYVFGGIKADNPLPVQPSTGTAATNVFLRVFLTRTPMAAWPASLGTRATANNAKGDHG